MSLEFGNQIKATGITLQQKQQAVYILTNIRSEFHFR
jgi:hypothetical protein